MTGGPIELVAAIAATSTEVGYWSLGGPTRSTGPVFKLAIPWGPENLHHRWFATSDPPAPDELTNALGAIDDYLSDADLAIHPSVRSIEIGGYGVAAVIRLETGLEEPAPRLAAQRSDLEEIFRIAATESLAERSQNPGLAAGDAELLVSTLCIVLATARRYRVATVSLHKAST